ncbi:uncharacterized protein [Scyliorhinus torazame]|uniref:uncharacterized protein isoform X2 n=1 Tax=Scyliorhinus torazame TaxID=75743 RepID=UPI003B59A7B3
MVDFSTRRWDRRQGLGASGSWHGQGLLPSPPLTLSELARSPEGLHRARSSPLRFQDSLPEDLECFDPLCPCRGVRVPGSVNPSREEPLPLARRLFYDPSDGVSAPLTNGAVDLGPYDWMTARRRYSLSRLPDTSQADDPLRSSSPGLTVGHSDVNLKACLFDSGKRRAQLVDRLKEAHVLIEGQSVELRKREDQLLESKAKIELLSVKQKQLENSISHLEGEKNMLEMSRLEDQKKSGALQNKVSHLEAEMAKTKSSLDLISHSHGTNPSQTSLFSLTKLEDGPLKQGKDRLLRELQSVRETLRVYQDRMRSLEEERDKASEDFRNFREVQHSVLMKTNEANQRLTDSLRVQTGLHDEVNELRLKYSKASLEKDVLSSKSVRLEESVANLRTQLTSAATKKERFLQEKLDLHKQVQHLTLELERALRGREGFDDQVADLHTELVSTKSQANRQDQEKVLLKEKLAAVKQVNEKLTSELGESRRRLELCQDQLHQLQAEKKIVSNQIEALETERGQLVSEKEMLLTAVQSDDKAHEDELLALRQNCKELWASEADLREHRGCLEAELERKAEELAAITLEQHQVAQHWKEKWQETAEALKAKEKELHLATVKPQGKNEKADLSGGCESFAADLEELLELRATLTRMTAERVQSRKQQEESERIIHLLQLQRDINSESTLQGSPSFAGKLDDLHVELQRSRDRIHELEKEKVEMEKELKKFKLESTPLARVELHACKQELELEKIRSQKLQHQVCDLKRTTQLQNQSSQAAAAHQVRRRQIAASEGKPFCLDPDGICTKDNEDTMSFEGHLPSQMADKAMPEIHINDQKRCVLSMHSQPVRLPQELLPQVASLLQELKDAKVIQRQQNAIIQGLREELEEANLSKPGEIKASLEEVDGELFLVREELQKVWDMLHIRNSELEEQHQELESARGQYTECSSENQRLEFLVTSLKQQISEKEQALRQLGRLRNTEKTELEIKISSLELKLAEVDVLEEIRQQRSHGEESEKQQSCPLQKCTRCDSFLEQMSTKLQDYSAKNSELQEERNTALKSLNDVQVLTQGLEETMKLEEHFSQTLQRENQSFSRCSRLMTDQLATLVNEQEDLTKVYKKLPENRKGNASLEYWAPRSHLVQNVVEMVKSQEGQQLQLEEENQRLKEAQGFLSFQKLEEEIHSLQRHLDSKTEKMSTMACEMEALREKNECLMKANVKDWQQVQSLREQSKDSFVATPESVAVSRLSDGQPSNPWARHLLQGLQPANQRDRDPPPRQMGDMAFPTATNAPSVRDEPLCLASALPGQGALNSQSAPRTEAWLSGISASQLQPNHSPAQSSAALTQSRTPSPPRSNCPDPPLNVSRSSLDFSSASEGPSEDEKAQGRTMPSAMKCSLLLSPRPFRLHRMNRNKK